MVYKMEWLIAEDVLLVAFQADITLNDLQQMVDDLHHHMETAPDDVHVIIELSKQHAYPAQINDLLPVAKRYYALPNLHSTILVTDDTKLWMIGKMLSKIFSSKQSVAMNIQTALKHLNKTTNTTISPATIEALAG